MTAEQLKKINEQLKTLSIKGKEYVQVTERVKAFREICPNGTISTDIISMDGEKVVMKATIADGDQVLATGLAYEKESSSFINKTSYIENCETSAVGRALGFLGIGIDGSMCSAEELVNALKQQEISKQKIDGDKAAALATLCLEKNVSVADVCERYGVEKLQDLTEDQHLRARAAVEKSSGNRKD